MNLPTPAELQTWVAHTVSEDIGSIIPKVQEYGAFDLEVMGAAMVGGMEAATEFYLLGKVARAMSAHRSGFLPSEDTLKDQLIYAIMVRFIRENGTWGIRPADPAQVPNSSGVCCAPGPGGITCALDVSHSGPHETGVAW